MPEKVTKLYIFGPEDYGEGIYYLLAGTGEVLASHLCSDISYAPGDLYLDRPERVKEFGERFGKIQINIIGQSDLTREEMISRNKKFYDFTGNKELTKTIKEE